MTFLDTIRQGGYALALSIFKRIHGDNFSDDFSFEEWHDVVKVCQKCNDGFWLAIAGKQLYQSAKTYQQWKIVRNFVPQERYVIATRMFDTISSFEECVDFQVHHFHELELTYSASMKITLCQKAVVWAISFEHWHWIHTTLPVTNTSTVLKANSLAEMEQLASNFSDMMWLHRYATNEDMQARIFNKLVALAKYS